MAVTALDIVDILYTRLKTPVSSFITGKLYKGSRPVNNDGEDVVINVLPLNNLQLQNAVANVNIHAAPLSFTVNGVVNKGPNYSRLNALVKQIKPLLEEQWQDDYHFTVQQESILQDDGGNAFINIRIDFYSENILN